MEILNEVLTVDRFCRKPCCVFELLNFTDEMFKATKQLSIR